MKKSSKLLRVVLCALLALCVGFCLFACTPEENADPAPPPSSGDGNEPTTPTPPLKEFTGIAFESKTVDYDGSEHSIVVSGTLPDGAKVDYENNAATNAGEYSAKAVLSCDNYVNKTLSATLKINKAEFTGITFTDKTVVWTGGTHSVTVQGEIPSGTDVKYDNNTGKDAGEYEATVTLTNPNYKTLILHAKLKINSLTNVAKGIIDSLLNKPDPWNFLPEALAKENMAYSSDPSLDFGAGFISVKNIPDKPIGKQMNVLYEGLFDAENMLGYVDTVYAVGNTIAEVYQTYINRNPDDYSSFIGSAAGFKVKITLDGANSKILAGNSTVSVELSYDGNSGKRTGRIQITSGAALKYESDDDYLKFAIRVGVKNVANIKQIEFVRNDGGTVAGYMREFTGTETKNLKTSAVIASNSKYTVIMSDKRESDDLKINGYEEVYSSETGKFIGSEVAETVKINDFDTLWFNLYDVVGFDTVKVVDEQNDLNADTVYLNGSGSALVTQKHLFSRDYDVEMKDVWYIVKTVDNDGKTKYEKVKTTVPMLFVQKKYVEDFTSEITGKNDGIFTRNPVLPSATPMTANFKSMQNLFETVKNEVTREDIENYISEADAFFAKN